MKDIPEFLIRPTIIATYRASVVAKNRLFRLLFSTMRRERELYVPLRDTLRGWTESDWLDFGVDEARRAVYAKREAHRAAYEDAAATLTLLVAAPMDRLFRVLGEPILDRGVSSYVPEIPFARSVWTLANQYKHLGEWTHKPDAKRQSRDKAIIAALVENHLRTDAAAEFLHRSAFEEYEGLEAALLSCSDGLSDVDLVPRGDDGIITVTLMARPTTDSRPD